MTSINIIPIEVTLFKKSLTTEIPLRERSAVAQETLGRAYEAGRRAKRSFVVVPGPLYTTVRDSSCVFQKCHNDHYDIVITQLDWVIQCDGRVFETGWITGSSPVMTSNYI